MNSKYAEVFGIMASKMLCFLFKGTILKNVFAMKMDFYCINKQLPQKTQYFTFQLLKIHMMFKETIIPLITTQVTSGKLGQGIKVMIKNQITEEQ